MTGAKRKRPSSPESTSIYSSKTRAKAVVEARVDPTYGQRSALPGLDIGNGQEYDCDGAGSCSEEDGEIGVLAIEYLQSVR